MKQPLHNVIESIEPLVEDAVQALRRYHEAQAAGAPPEKLEHLRLEAEKRFASAAQRQRDVLGEPLPDGH